VVAAICYNIRFYPLCLEAQARIAPESWATSITSLVLRSRLAAVRYRFQLARAGRGGRTLAGSRRHPAPTGLDLVKFVTAGKWKKSAPKIFHRHSHSPPAQWIGGYVSNKLASQRETELVAINTEDYASILFHMQGGTRGCFTVSQVNAAARIASAFEIAGSKGSLAGTVSAPTNSGSAPRQGQRAAHPRSGSVVTEARPSQLPRGHNEGFPDTFKQLFAPLRMH